MKKYIEQNWFTILAGMMLLLAIPSIWPYVYYQLLRWVVMIVAGYNAYLAYESKEDVWMYVMVGVAILFNPIASIHFQKETWAILDLVTALVMFASIKKINK